MNIGSMLRAFLGDATPLEGTRALELRVGQIVRGVLLEMLDQQEALISINGVNVRAKLEADMPLGRGTLLQVQPSSNGGAVVLKPLSNHSELPQGEEWKDVLRTFGLPDQKWSMELMRGLKRDGYGIGRETAAWFSSAAELKPSGVDSSVWMGAADVAFRRGLPMTETTIESIRQSLFGEPLHETLGRLRSELTAWLGAVGGKAGGPSAEVGTRLAALLVRGAELLAAAEQELARPFVGARAENTSPSVDRGTVSVRGASFPSTLTTEAALEAGNAGVTMRIGADGTLNGGRTVPPGAVPLSGQSETLPSGERGPTLKAQVGGRLQAGMEVPAPTMNGTGSASAQANDLRATNDNLQTAMSGARSGNEASQPTKAESAWIGRLLQWLGVDHELRSLHMPSAAGRLEAGMVQESADLTAGGGAGTLSVDSTADRARDSSASDSLKSALLGLMSHDDLPASLRESAQTLLHQITGQQLMLATERGQTSPFSHMTLFVPMGGQGGETTATVHVQTRRGRKGEWDADNCRLLFDLRMRTLGNTIVDVQVVDRIVSLKLMNDFPEVANLLEGAREELTSGLREAGFQLLSLSVAPLPSLRPVSEGSVAEASFSETSLYPDPSAYASKPYKGVDYRA